MHFRISCRSAVTSISVGLIAAIVVVVMPAGQTESQIRLSGSGEDVNPDLNHGRRHLSTRQVIMSTVQPWIVSAADYKALKRLMPDDPDLPDTYDEWFNLASEQAAKAAKGGRTMEKITVNPDEFAVYCDRAGLDRNYWTLGAYAVAVAEGYKE